jgi:choline oxidase
LSLEFFILTIYLMPYDYIVVGGGTAGVVIAYRLAKAGIGSVLLIEAGVSDADRPEVLQLNQWQSLLKSDYDYDYAIEPQQKGNDLMRHSRAKVMGGCSSHNSAIAFQAPDHDFYHWQTLGVEGWEPATVKSFYQKVLEKVNVEVSDSQNACGKALLQACHEYGIPLVNFQQATYREGGGWFSLNKKEGLRQSTSVAYLHPYDAVPANLTIMTQTMVTGLVINEEKRVTRLKTSQGDLTVNKEVILSGGAFNTPQLLKKTEKTSQPKKERQTSQF